MLDGGAAHGVTVRIEGIFPSILREANEDPTSVLPSREDLR